METRRAIRGKSVSLPSAPFLLPLLLTQPLHAPRETTGDARVHRRELVRVLLSSPSADRSHLFVAPWQLHKISFVSSDVADQLAEMADETPKKERRPSPFVLDVPKRSSSRPLFERLGEESPLPDARLVELRASPETSEGKVC